ncbi:AP2 domain-containing protein [Marinilactibacillus psychrotolerans]|uniref:AP2 domain-containing protein n=2 Tax=Marinilactibacillus psychrotolerans TaxID=191770 RepID=A0A5R9BVD4_9LACT|nr:MULTISPECIES: AP2 domain-containing protein [Marinilactibacillus]TLQ03951.1 AP2 domain-containing protein [Marinilactibacillus psychrotolerans]
MPIKLNGDYTREVINIKTKTCTKCGLEKPLNDQHFHKRKDNKSGFRNDCKVCRKKYLSEWTSENHKKKKDGMKRWYKEKQKECPEYFSWTGMKARCYNKNHTSYPNYGLRGIKICEEWLNDFGKFLEDMGKKPTENHSIERIDNDKNYSPDNCRWATHLEQSWNRGVYSNNKTGVIGVSWSKKDNKWWAEIKADGEKHFLGTYDDFEEATKARKEAEEKYHNVESAF